jgi:fructose-specific phosphotransferase system IIA component
MVELSKLLSVDRIVDLKGKNKEQVIHELVDVISRAEQIIDKERFLNAILERERILSTGVGLGVAVPHAKMDAVSDFVVAVGRSMEGVDFDSLDGKPVHIVVMIGASEEQKDDYIKVLAKVISLLKKEHIRERIMKAQSPEQIMSIFSHSQR